MIPLADVARAMVQGVFIMEALWGRFCPAQQALRALIRSGAIGEPLQGDARCAFLADFAHRRLIDPVLGGGGLLDVGAQAPIVLRCCWTTARSRSCWQLSAGACLC